jgi:hypothetical protein
MKNISLSYNGYNSLSHRGDDLPVPLGMSKLHPRPTHTFLWREYDLAYGRLFSLIRVHPPTHPHTHHTQR